MTIGSNPARGHQVIPCFQVVRTLTLAWRAHRARAVSAALLILAMVSPLVLDDTSERSAPGNSTELPGAESVLSRRRS